MPKPDPKKDVGVRHKQETCQIRPWLIPSARSSASRSQMRPRRRPRRRQDPPWFAGPRELPSILEGSLSTRACAAASPAARCARSTTDAEEELQEDPTDRQIARSSTSAHKRSTSGAAQSRDTPETAMGSSRELFGVEQLIAFTAKGARSRVECPRIPYIAGVMQVSFGRESLKRFFAHI